MRTVYKCGNDPGNIIERDREKGQKRDERISLTFSSFSRLDSVTVQLLTRLPANPPASKATPTKRTALALEATEPSDPNESELEVRWVLSRIEMVR